MRRVIPLCLALAALAGCHEDAELERFLDAEVADAAPDAAPRCEAGETRPCAIEGGCMGEETCADGAFGRCVPPPETCDGADDDCDGTTDEGFAVGEVCVVGTGACAVEGVTVCTAAGDGVECPAEAGEPTDEVCNGLDDDCDEVTDEAIGSAPCETGEPGICAAGATACVDGATVCPALAEPADETCDGLDNDCDGATDEGEDGALTRPCYEGPDGTEGVGVCVGGTATCADGAFGDCADQVLPGAEVCNGADDDCDGTTDQTDDGVAITGPCYDGPDGTEGVGICLGGTATCVDGVFGACADQVLPGVESCNLLDDDCNGAADDIDFGVCICRPGSEALCYTGPPETEGIAACRGGTWTCAPDGTAYGPCINEVTPQVEACDGGGQDLDCDGLTDCDDPDCDAAVLCLREACNNGVDDDLDGYVDCNDADCAARPVCQRPDVRVCGRSGLNIASLFQPEDAVVVAAGCEVGPDVRAVFIVSRTGAQVPGLAEYIAEGGRAITEFGGSAAAFTAVFGEAAAPGPQRGRCYDNVIPVVRLTEDDPFWQTNGNLPLVPLLESGCGLDMAAYPGITPLGSVDANNVSLAYRDHGLGRLWLVETDWQDGENLPGRSNPQSRALLRAMALDPFDPSCDRQGACFYGRECVDGICVRPAP